MSRLGRMAAAVIIRPALAAVGLVLVGAVTVAPAQAAHPQIRDGWFLGLGVGGGSAGESSSDGREGGAAGSFRVGYAFNSPVGFGLESNAWTKEQNGVRVSFNTGAATLFYYPGEGAVLRAGVGVGSADVSTKIGNVTVSANESGFGLTVGGQYEFRVTRRFALGPQVDFSWMTLDSFDANYVMGGLSLNWYFIPK